MAMRCWEARGPRYLGGRKLSNRTKVSRGAGRKKRVTRESFPIAWGKEEGVLSEGPDEFRGSRHNKPNLPPGELRLIIKPLRERKKSLF